ncbi:5-formyltetrahydrofolate cyclo-ligase [Williamsia sterculiae]|uniref:5-formyltetrahydrofolate cyclo-ligase n=1 Tax=Williamsia sterculiae TaxID=1344003 RepID=A0A1N7DLB5_9NOCA|nr:5-formyltetrahydrofolate cyclo-ligase [Williamsia sterculiae]SIR76653.1 5-formyltetrahydrofolate cyclo-ligase [Williamsia sterculiae]
MERMGHGKAQWRERLTTRRIARTGDEQASAAVRLTALIGEIESGPLGRPLRTATIAAYLPQPPEPGDTGMLDALVATGATVIVPKVAPGPPAPLDWARYEDAGQLVVARFGLREPAGAAVGIDAVGGADVVLVPALGVDRRGVRLGRGAGYYDRTLGAAADAALVAVVYDDELFDELPEDPLDVRVGWVLRPGTGFTPLT